MTYSTQGGNNNGPIVTPGGLGSGGSSGFAPLVANVEYWVDSASGNDANSGAMATPWATLQRALDERAKYGELQARFHINLVGTGPYTFPGLANSVCVIDGRFELVGDITAQTVSASGTFTGNINAGGVIGTSAGLGVDTYKGQFVRVLSGALVGCEFQILSHTDASITVANQSAWDYGGGSTANGDTFEIFIPTTELNVGTSYISDCRGGAIDVLDTAAPPQHFMRYLRLTGGGTLTLQDSTWGMTTVHADTITLQAYGKHSKLQLGLYKDSSFFSGGASGDYLFAAAGLYYTATSVKFFRLDYGADCMATFFSSTNIVVVTATYEPANFLSRGIRCDNQFIVTQGFANFISDAAVRSMLMTLAESRVAKVLILHAVLFAPTSSFSCILLAYDAQIILAQDLVTGTAIAAGRYGIDALDNGTIVFSGSGLPLLTGGTAGQDIRVQGVAPFANATLAAAGNSVKSTTTNALAYRRS